MRLLRGNRVRTLAAAAATMVGICVAAGAAPATAAENPVLVSGAKYYIRDASQSMYVGAQSMEFGGFDALTMAAKSGAHPFSIHKVGAPDGTPIENGDQVYIKDEAPGWRYSWGFSWFEQRLGTFTNPDYFKIKENDGDKILTGSANDEGTHLKLTDLTSSSIWGNNVSYLHSELYPALTLDSSQGEDFVFEPAGG